MKIHDEEFEDLLVESVTLDPEDLVTEYARVAADLTYWTRRLARLEAEVLRAKAEIKTAEAKGHLMVSDKAADSGKKLTEKLREMYVTTMPSVVAANENLAKVTEAYREARGYVDGVSAKRDMLIQLGATRRQEMKAHLID